MLFPKNIKKERQDFYFLLEFDLVNVKYAPSKYPLRDETRTE